MSKACLRKSWVLLNTFFTYVTIERMSTKQLPLSIVLDTKFPKAHLSLRTLPRMAFHCPNTDAGGSVLSLPFSTSLL